MLELERRAGEQLGQLALAKCFGVGIEPPRIGAERTVRLDRAQLGALEHIAVGTLVSMASRAGIHVERAPALDGGGIDPMRAARRLKVAEPGGDTFDGGMVDGLRRDAGAERG